MYTVEGCGVCEETRRTVVCEYNRLIFHDSMWDKDLARYNYALCHGCGIVYSTRRPERAEYEFLYENFSEFLLRAQRKDLEAETLTPELTEKIDREFVPWWELREAPIERMKIREYLRTDFKRSLRYLPHILSTANVEGAKVLYIRAKTSGLVAVLRKVCGASQVDVTTLFPAVKYLCEKNEGVRAICDVDFEDFKIPYADKYDLIIENHILIHMIDPKSTFAMLTEHLNENGAIFLRHELDDVRLFGKSKNLFAELRPFHFNQFDIPALERMLQHFGFDPVGIRHRIDGKSEVIGTARLNGNARKKFRPISREQLKARLQMYAQWRDESILSLPTERCRALFGDEVQDVWQRIDKRVGFSRTKHRKMIRKFAEANIREEDVELFAETLRRKPSLRKSGTSLKSRLFGRNWLQSP